MPWVASFILIFLALFSLFAIGMPIGFAMVFVSVFGLILSGGLNLDQTLHLITNISYSRTILYAFVAIPLFILMTELLFQSGLTNKLISISHKLMGRTPGGLAVVAVVASTVFGAMCSSLVLGAMVMSETLLPECMKRKYDKSLIIGAIAAGDTLSILIPPSGFFILWGIIAGVSIGDLFIAGILPGILAAIMFVTYIVIRAKRNPALAPALPAVSTKEKIMAVAGGWDIVLFIIILLGGIYAGIATVTEIGGVASLVALVLGLIHRTLPLSKIYFALKRTAALICSFMIILIGAYLFNYYLSYMEIPQNLSEWIIDANLTSIQLVIVVMVMFFILGCFMEASSIILITLPLFLPTLNALGVDLLWLGILVTINSMIASLTPPVGMTLFIVQAMGKPHGITYVQIVRGVIPFIFLMILLLAIVIAVPSVATWLPHTMD